MRIDMTFDEWFREVDDDMLRIAGVGTDRVAYRKWHSWYEDGYSPMQAAETALMNTGFPFDENYYFG